MTDQPVEPTQQAPEGDQEHTDQDFWDNLPEDRKARFTWEEGDVQFHKAGTAGAQPVETKAPKRD
jgi:hypothetical protein